MDLWKSSSLSHKPQSPHFFKSGEKNGNSVLRKGTVGDWGTQIRGDKDWPNSYINH